MTILTSVINKRLVKWNLDSLFFEIVRIECVDNTTAARTRGIAGKDINWIRVSPSEFKLAVAFGRKNPRISEKGNM